MCFTGLPLVTLAMTAAVIAYLLREVENWYEGDPASPLLAIYAAHPLHQRTRWQHGFTMLTAEQAGDLDQQWMTKLDDQNDTQDGELDPAA